MSDRIAEPFLTGSADYLHGITFGGHPVGASIALKAIEIMEREEVLDNVRANEPLARELLEGLKDIPIVGDVRGMGHFFAIEVVRDQDTREALTEDEAGWLLKDVLSDRLWEKGMICRLDDRAEPIVQIAPPLVAEAALFEEIAEILRDGLTHAAERLEAGKPD
jgi:adenosylmethionine-8-amino-7-oxononanoate aminotransferase